MEERRMDWRQPREITARARHLARRASRFVHERPLQVIALTIGVGFVMGKILGGRQA